MVFHENFCLHTAVIIDKKCPRLFIIWVHICRLCDDDEDSIVPDDAYTTQESSNYAQYAYNSSARVHERQTFAAQSTYDAARSYWHGNHSEQQLIPSDTLVCRITAIKNLLFISCRNIIIKIHALHHCFIYCTGWYITERTTNVILEQNGRAYHRIRAIGMQMHSAKGIAVVYTWVQS